MEHEKLQSLSEVVAGQAQLMEEMTRRIEGQREEIQMLGAILARTIQELSDLKSEALWETNPERTGLADGLESMAYDAGTIGQCPTDSYYPKSSKKQAPEGSYSFKVHCSDNFAPRYIAPESLLEKD